ncbi:MAG: bifunctional class I SAM-dependent methyltransferase/glycosyltransferase family 2 protein [Deltaproteobacteria bacterium]|nr:bifunctional class I SAM-dependent methyltransferase/glycosyltransferase family 2 protein [Deltaproteobacteria bacterium]
MNNASQTYLQAAKNFQAARIQSWEKVAAKRPPFWSRYYHRRLMEVYRHNIPPGMRVMELGCGLGDLLATVRPAYGLGVDFCPGMVEKAKQRHPDLHFALADAHDLKLKEKPFDFIIISDLVNDLWDVQQVLTEAARYAGPSTRLVINGFSHLWGGPLRAVRALGLATSQLNQNWLTRDDIHSLLVLSGFDLVSRTEEVMWPVGTPLVSGLFNRFVAKLWPFSHLALTHVRVARPAGAIRTPKPPVVSVIVPARNEAGNVPQIFERIPQMGGGTEVIFVEGHSRDNTYETALEYLKQHPKIKAKVFRQTGEGKGDAVRLGYAHATGDILMILDADLTVAPETLPLFYEAIYSGKGEFINGVRLVYPMADEAMRFFNLLGNKFFSMAFTWLLGQPVKDSLCGTKVLWKQDYLRLAENRSYFGNFDPFGDFDLLFGAARLNLKIVDLPIRYQARTYGSTNIQRWRHGWLLLKMVLFAARRIKFI